MGETLSSHPFHATHDCIDLCDISPHLSLFQTERYSASQVAAPNCKTDLSLPKPIWEDQSVSAFCWMFLKEQHRQEEACEKRQRTGTFSLCFATSSLVAWAKYRCPGMHLGFSPVEWWCKYFPELTSCSEVGITSTRKSTGCWADTVVRPQCTVNAK